MTAAKSISDTRKKISDAIGKDNISDSSDSIKGFFEDGKAPDAELLVATPASIDELARIMKIMNEEEVPVHTLKDSYLPVLQAKSGGVIIDFSKMDKIERLDRKNLMAHVQRNATLSELKKAAKDNDMTPQAPVLKGSGRAVDIFVNRSVWNAACRYPEVAVSNMAVVLADGRILKTGSHALNEEVGDNKEDGGPNLTRWFLAGEDIYGIVARASLWMFPIMHKRSALAFGFDDMDAATKAVKEIPRREIGQEYLAMDSDSAKELFGIKSDKPWVAVVGFASKDYVVEGQEARVTEMATSYKGATIEVDSDKIVERLQEPMYNGNADRLAFFSSYAKLGGLLDKVKSSAKIEQHLVVSYSRGRSAYNVIKLGDGADIQKVAISLVGEGAFFDRPLGKLAEEVYSKSPSNLNHMKRIKKFMDPKGILNPGAITKEL